MTKAPVIMWFRRDLRFSDHMALTAAVATGHPIIPVFIHDDIVARTGAASKQRLGLAVANFAGSLRNQGSKLILRRGDPLMVLRALIKETGAGAVYWSRLYDPDAKARDTVVKSALKNDGIDARSFAGHLLFEPWTVETKTGGFYKVYSPMWKTVRDRDLGDPLPAPGRISTPDVWPVTDDLDDWNMDAPMQRGAAILAQYCAVGETAAHDRLDAFIAEKVADYKKTRDLPAVNGTSRLSENLTYGEISPRQCWSAGWRALDYGKAGAEIFLKELVWREFGYHLAHHTPRLLTGNWREEWDDFPWQTEDTPEVIAWKQGSTGIQFVDAAMREMYVTGTMHNRARMIVASYLTKHLMTHWRVGLDWFADCLIDWDPCSNALGWQWTAGCGPDAAPYFRVFNPDTQLDKFDPDRDYVNMWIAEQQKQPPKTALSYFSMIPNRWNLSASQSYPVPAFSLSEGRARALAAYQARG